MIAIEKALCVRGGTRGRAGFCQIRSGFRWGIGNFFTGSTRKFPENQAVLFCYLSMILFVVASLFPALLIVPGAILGANWGWAALIHITIVTFAADRFRLLAPRDDRITGDWVLLVQASVHFAVLGLTVWSLSRGIGDGALAVAAGLYLGQVSNSAAHELIHRPGRGLRRVGAAMFASLLFGQHVSSHLLVHHVWVATPNDPNTARRGQGFWNFLPRAWWGSLVAGMAAERARRPGLPFWRLPHAMYLMGAVLSLSAGYAIGGARGVAIWSALAVFAQFQLMLSDYVQHYGLLRAKGPNGKPVPVGPEHSWNATSWLSGSMMLNATHHSAHHVSPMRAFPGLEVDEARMPVLPSSFQMMATIALFPTLWRRVMDWRVAGIRAGDSGNTRRFLQNSAA